VSSRLVVIGSVNADLVVTAPRFARPGETILGGSFAFHPGGKGANQAVAAARLGASVSFVGRVGSDHWGERLRSTLAGEGVGVEHLRSDALAPSGVAAITVVPGGENSIVVAPGANGCIGEDDVDRARGLIAQAASILLQGEIPGRANLRAAELARQHGVRVMWNAAPMAEDARGFCGRADLVVVNRGEAAALAGRDGAPLELAGEIVRAGAGLAVVTLGDEGAIAWDGKAVVRRGAFAAGVVDTTGAGDAFAGALAVAIGEGRGLGSALEFACAAGALAVGVAGAMTSLPSREAVERLVAGPRAEERREEGRGRGRGRKGFP
jgi:ribokinase